MNVPALWAPHASKMDHFTPVKVLVAEYTTEQHTQD